MSNEIITKETLDTVIKGGESIAKVLSGTATDLMNEAIALFLVDSVLSIVKFAAVFVVFFIVKKYCDVAAEASGERSKQKFNAFKTSALVASIIFFTASSFPHIRQIGKAMVAPKMFLLEKANELRK